MTTILLCHANGATFPGGENFAFHYKNKKTSSINRVTFRLTELSFVAKAEVFMFPVAKEYFWPEKKLAGAYIS